MINPEHYTYRHFWSEEDQQFVCLCAEFPGLSWLADTPDAALRGMLAMISEVTADMTASGEPIPVPIAHKQFSGKFAVRIPPESHRKLAMEAAEQNISLNRLVSMKLA
ncbi:MAG: toxin-antitoxin system HicB family antitoxin [Alphaproteobacteria bacterium]|nr:toxin-antitoxin system HicB family antitoxin [Alphaproteobacteria bacterium]